MNRLAVADAAPATPACFSDRGTWVEYLHSAQEGKKKPFRKGVFQPSYNFCADCTLEHSARMERAGRCHPCVFVAADEPDHAKQEETAPGC